MRVCVYICIYIYMYAYVYNIQYIYIYTKTNSSWKVSLCLPKTETFYVFSLKNI